MSEASLHSPFASIEEAVAELRAGRMIIILDDEDRENEGDLACAAELVTPEIVNFMATYGRGLICLPMSCDRLDELQIPLMVEKNTARLGTAFCVSIEARRDVSTGISAPPTARAPSAPRWTPPPGPRTSPPGPRLPPARPQGGRPQAARARPRPRWTSAAWAGSRRRR
jgi:hypothetical protein